jgi:3-oxoacyl-[acyl-carrier protein] reductase
VHDRANNLAEIDRRFAINVGGVAAAVRAAAPLMGEGGRIISIGSVAGGWARDLGPQGITVNNVQPGPIDTDMNPADSDFAASVTASTAVGRYGKPEEVAAAVAFLASPEAGRNVECVWRFER